MKLSSKASTADSVLPAYLSPWLLSSVALYGVSFLLTVRVLAVNPLSVASPAMAGATFGLITLLSWVLLGEALGMQKLAGIVLICGGIWLLARA